VQSLYESSSDIDRPAVLIAYAFDRFTSASERFRELLHLSPTDTALVSSGLFWIWSLLSSELGIVIVRSNGVEVTFDLSHGAKPRLGTIEQLRAAMSVRNVVADGTIDPLTPAHSNVESADGKHHAFRRPFHRPKAPTTLITSTYGSAIWPSLIRQCRVLHRWPKPPCRWQSWRTGSCCFLGLRRVHEKLGDSDILLLDLCGARPLWTKATALPLAHFFVEANYTSVFGRSAVVLWNVPESAAVVFSQAIRIASERFEQLRDVRRLAVTIFDSGRMQLFAGAPSMEERFAKLADEGAIPLSTFLAGRGARGR